MHAVCGYLAKSTWLNAIRAGNLAGWPLLNVENVYKHYLIMDETPMGHLNQSRARVRSTKIKIDPLPEATEDDLKPLLGKKIRDLYFKVVDTWDPKYKIYSDQTGKFPVQSRAGYRYIMVMVEIDSNNVLLQPMKTKSDEEMIDAYEALMKRLRRVSIAPEKHVLNNECSEI